MGWVKKSTHRHKKRAVRRQSSSSDSDSDTDSDASSSTGQGWEVKNLKYSLFSTLNNFLSLKEVNTSFHYIYIHLRITFSSVFPFQFFLKLSLPTVKQPLAKDYPSLENLFFSLSLCNVMQSLTSCPRQEVMVVKHTCGWGAPQMVVQTYWVEHFLGFSGLSDAEFINILVLLSNRG